jgi:glycosyltransferase involved in cell wall biosynthesis
MAEVLLTVSGVIAPDTETRVAAGEMPRRDFLELARALPADLVDYGRMRAEASPLGRLIERLAGPNAALAWHCYCQRGRYRVVLTDGEQVGIPLALLLKYLGRRGVRHVMISHVLSVGKKKLFFDRLGIQSHVDRFLVYSIWQKRYIEERWGVAPEGVVLMPFQADSRFFQPAATPPEASPDADTEPVICAVGLERRDYPTLIQAVRELPHVRLMIAASSPWSKWGNSTAGEEIPANVTVRRFTWDELRALYVRSRFVVVPLYEVDFQAGVTTILEAMATARAVIVTRTPGQTDVVVEGETGLYVPPDDPQALCGAMQRLLDDPDEAARMGANGRRLLEERMSLDRYVERIKGIVEQVGQRHA